MWIHLLVFVIAWVLSLPLQRKLNLAGWLSTLLAGAFFCAIWYLLAAGFDFPPRGITGAPLPLERSKQALLEALLITSFALGVGLYWRKRSLRANRGK